MDQWTHEYLKKLYNAGYRYIATDAVYEVKHDETI